MPGIVEVPAGSRPAAEIRLIAEDVSSPGSPLKFFHSFWGLLALDNQILLASGPRARG